MVSIIIFPSIIAAFIFYTLLMLPMYFVYVKFWAYFKKGHIIEVLLVLCILTHSENCAEFSHVILGINLKSRDIVYISICAYE